MVRSQPSKSKLFSEQQVKLGLLGRNGAGKTTIILMLLGLTEPSSGSCRVFGYDPVKKPLNVKKLCGYLPERFGFL